MEIEIIYDYKELFFNIINANSISEAKEKRNQLFYLNSKVPKVIRDLTEKLIIPEFKKITNHLTDPKIAITYNKIENYFLKNFSKYIKRVYKQKMEF